MFGSWVAPKRHFLIATSFISNFESKLSKTDGPRRKLCIKIQLAKMEVRTEGHKIVLLFTFLIYGRYISPLWNLSATHSDFFTLTFGLRYLFKFISSGAAVILMHFGGHSKFNLFFEVILLFQIKVLTGNGNCARAANDNEVSGLRK